MKGLFIINPSSGKQNIDSMLREIMATLILDQICSHVDVFYTKGKDDAKNRAAELKPGDYDFIVSVGGDGTLNEVTNGLILSESNIPMAIISAGTVNDFATYMKLPQTADGFCQMIKDFQTKKVDVGRVNNEYFINVLAAGMLTDIAYKVPKDKHGKELWNHHKMVKRTMFNYDGVEGGKTGYTTKAGGTLVTFAKRGDQELIVVDLCAHGYELYEDTIKMLNYGFNNYKTIAPFKTMNTVLKDDTYGFLKTGNELSPYKIPLKHLNDVTVMLEKNQSASKLTYKCKDNKYIISYDGKQIGSVKLH